MNENELKRRCPFCNSDDLAVWEQEEYHPHGRFYVCCCNCYATGPNRKTYAMAMSAWNGRPKEDEK